MVFLRLINIVYRHIFGDSITYPFCPGQNVLHGGLVAVWATNFTMSKLKRFFQMQIQQ